MALLTREQILSADDIKSQRVKVPEWGGDVIVRTMTGDERDEFEMAAVSDDGERLKVARSKIRATIVMLSCVNGKGKRLFTIEDVEALGQRSSAALDRVVAVAQELSKIGDEELEAAGKG